MFSTPSIATPQALFVESGGVYSEIIGSDRCWDIRRDARGYRTAAQPDPVVAHPPCKRWGRYARGGPNPKSRRYEVGDDAGCFAAALNAVRHFGGVIEHPEASHAWAAFGLRKPKWREGWVSAEDGYGGWTCCVSQFHYGHRSRKLTWLYVCGMTEDELPELNWTIPKPGETMRLEEGCHNRAADMADRKPRRRVSAEERYRPPPTFAALLLGIASRCRGYTTTKEK